MVDLEAGHKVIGVVTDRDLCLAVVAAGSASGFRVGAGRHDIKEHRDVPARVRSQKKLSIACGRNQIRRVSIVDAEGKLCGVVAMADIPQRSDLSSDAMHEVFKTISEPSEHASRPRAQMQRAA